MSLGIVGYDNTGDANQPSPAIWGSCPGYDLISSGLGWFAEEDFQAHYAITTTVDSSPIGSGRFTYMGDTDTSINSVADTHSGIIDMETNTTIGDAGSLVTNAFGRIVRNSGNRLWFETRVAVGDIAGDLGTFVGLVEEDGADENVIADDPATNASTASGVTLLGFYQNNANKDAFNIINKKEGGTVEEVLADVTNATAIPLASRTALINGVGATEVGFHKFGIFFDGRTTISYYVDGYKVATDEVDSAVDQTNYLAAIVAVKTGAAAAEKVFVDWVRYGFEERR